MNRQLNAALAMHDFFFENLKLNYTVIGGIALQFWGEPRFTLDLDLTVEDRLDLGDLVKMTTEAFGSRVSDPYQFARQHRILLLSVEDVNVDIALALQGYEESLFERSQTYEVEPGKSIHICSAEDLIIHKALAGRSQDLADIEGVIYRQRDLLDVRYIRSWLRKFSSALDNPELLAHFEQAFANR
ncbi:MAG: nucleotidyltransferase [Anaerolineales bacterium]|nr:nucleotidyltransferase [Anaerolineales bacterium]